MCNVNQGIKKQETIFICDPQECCFKMFRKSSDYYCRDLTEDTSGLWFCLHVAGSGLPTFWGEWDPRKLVHDRICIEICISLRIRVVNVNVQDRNSYMPWSHHPVAQTGTAPKLQTTQITSGPIYANTFVQWAIRILTPQRNPSGEPQLPEQLRKKTVRRESFAPMF
jgi:hypothetical protein